MKDFSSPVETQKSAPKLFAWIASVMLIILIITSQFLPRGHCPNIRVFGVAILLTSPGFIFLPFLLLSKNGKKKDGKKYMQSGDVVDNGLYAVVRHPQYLGYMLLALGFGFLSQNPFVLVMGIISITGFYFQALQEEKYCIDQFGKPYKNYLKQVPRFNIFLGIWKAVRGEQNDQT